jgi:TolB-like protein/DNA-binding winged helix-turn-helix (wHTH) protein
VPRSPRHIRFGEFDLDLQTAELRANGRKSTLPWQPFQVLAILLEQPGHLVSREELKKRLWPNETFGDFDQGLNKVVNRLREALQDSAEHPRFVETLPKLGYRFIQTQSSDNNQLDTLKEYIGRWKLAALAGICAVLVSPVIWYLRATSRSPLESVAVVPFVNLSGDPNTEYLGDGISETLIDRLSQIPDLTVLPRSAGVRYKGKDVDPLIVANELKVQAVVVGRINQRGDSLTVTAELVDAVHNRTLWGESYERRVSDVLEVEREISLEVSDRLRKQLTGGQTVRVSNIGTGDWQAYQSYLKGRYAWEKRTPEALHQAFDDFNEAIARDPNFAQAYVALADYWTVAPDFLSVPLSQALPREKDAALRALAIDSNYAPAHLALANVLFDSWEWGSAEREYQKALELDSKFASAHHWYGLSLSCLGRHREALVHLQRAVELDPLNLKFNADLGYGYVNARYYDLALNQLNHTLQMEPRFFITYEYLAQLYRAMGDHESWLRSWRKKAELQNPNRIRFVEKLSGAYAAGGYPAAVRTIIQAEKDQLPWRYVDPAELGYEYAALGDKNEAFRWLERAYQERSRALQSVRIEPSMDALRSDTRYINLLRRLGLGG